MIPFRTKAVKKVLVEALVAPLRLDLGGGDQWLLRRQERRAGIHLVRLLWCGGKGEK